VANSLSSRKRDRQNATQRARNRSRKSQLKAVVRKFDDAVHDGNVQTAGEVLVAVTKRIDQTAAKGAMHKNAAARKKSRLAKRLNKLRAKP